MNHDRSSGLELFIVDAFAVGPFTGNPAAVVLLACWLEDSVMQSIASQLRLSETAFVVSAGNQHELRWFTPAVEVELCGHATLAAGKIVMERDHLRSVRFDTKSGVLEAHRTEDGRCVEIDLPLGEIQTCDPPPGLLEALGVHDPVEVLRGKTDFVVRLGDSKAVETCRPTFGRLAEVDARGVIVTSESDYPGVDFVSRFFGPRVGVDEDPVTGSAHTLLAPYWARQLGHSELVAVQLSERGGRLDCRVRDSKQRVFLQGAARTVVEGRFHLTPTI